MAGHEYSIGSLLAPNKTHKANSTVATEAPQETETDKLKKSDVWTFAANMQQGCAFQG